MPAVHMRIASAEYTDETHTNAVIVLENGERRAINKFKDALDWQEMSQSVVLKHFIQQTTPTHATELARLQAEIAMLKSKQAAHQTLDLDKLLGQLVEVVKAEVASNQMVDITPVQQRIEALENVILDAVKRA